MNQGTPHGLKIVFAIEDPAQQGPGGGGPGPGTGTGGGPGAGGGAGGQGGPGGPGGGPGPQPPPPPPPPPPPQPLPFQGLTGGLFGVAARQVAEAQNLPGNLGQLMGRVQYASPPGQALPFALPASLVPPPSPGRAPPPLPSHQMMMGLGQLGIPGVGQVGNLMNATRLAGMPGAGMAAAMGPAGAAIALASVAADVLAGALNKAAEQVRVFGKGLEALANNDATGMFGAGVDFFANALKAGDILGINSKVIDAAAGFIKSIVETPAKVIDSFVKRGEQISGYNPQLAAANAMADVRSLMADMREANELGPTMARLTTIQSQLHADFRETMLPLKKVVMEVLIDVLEVLRGLLAAAKTAGGFLKEKAISINDILADGVGPVSWGAKLAKALMEYLGKQSQDDEKFVDFWDDLRNPAVAPNGGVFVPFNFGGGAVDAGIPRILDF